MSCPIHFVPEVVSDWYEEYAYAKEFGSMIPFEQRPARWLEAMRIYNGAYNDYVEEKLAKSKAKMPAMKGSSNG